MTDALATTDGDGRGPSTPPPIAVRLYTLDTVADMLGGVTRRYVEQLLADGSLRAVKVGRLVRVRDDELAAFIDAREPWLAS